MSRFLKVISVAGGVGTIAGIAGVTVLATQEENNFSYLYQPFKERSKGVGFGLDFDTEDVKKFLERKELRKKLSDGEIIKVLKLENKFLKENIEQLKTQKAELEKKK